MAKEIAFPWELHIRLFNYGKQYGKMFAHVEISRKYFEHLFIIQPSVFEPLKKLGVASWNPFFMRFIAMRSVDFSGNSIENNDSSVILSLSICILSPFSRTIFFGKFMVTLCISIIVNTGVVNYYF